MSEHEGATDLSRMESGGASAPVDPNSPLMQAWEQFKTSESYANSKKWVAFPEHVDGSLWNLFMVGWLAATAQERERCGRILDKARQGEIDTDLRSIKARIQHPE